LNKKQRPKKSALALCVNKSN